MIGNDIIIDFRPHDNKKYFLYSEHSLDVLLQLIIRELNIKYAGSTQSTSKMDSYGDIISISIVKLLENSHISVYTDVETDHVHILISCSKTNVDLLGRVRRLICDVFKINDVIIRLYNWR